MKRIVTVTIVVLLTVSSLGFAQSGHKLVLPGEIKWTTLFPGIELGVVSGDPSKEGEPFVVRIRLKEGARVPPHWHPVDENVTVISGSFFMGMGEKFDQAALHEMPAGSYVLMPKEVRHYAWVKGETVIQVHSVGPFKTIWVDQPPPSR
jgi:quercetin dioxygenase-like cupin family protein